MILLDSDAVSLFHAGQAAIVQRIADLDPSEVLGTTVITRAEVLRARFEFLLKSADGEQLQRAQFWLESSESLFADLYIATVDVVAATEFDKLRALKKLKKIGHADMLIARIALAHKALLVTRNVKHFSAIPKLRIENWAD